MVDIDGQYGDPRPSVEEMTVIRDRYTNQSTRKWAIRVLLVMAAGVVLMRILY